MSQFEKLKAKYLLSTQPKSKTPRKKKEPEQSPVDPDLDGEAHPIHPIDQGNFITSTTQDPTMLPPPEILPTQNTDTQPYKSIVRNPRIGAHISMQYGFKQAMEYAKSQGYNCAQMFTSSPRTIKASKPLDPTDAEQCKKYIADQDMELWIHCSYTINFCKPCCADSQHLRDCIAQDMRKAMALGASGCVLHVGKLNANTGTINPKDALLNFKHNIEHTITTLLKENHESLPWLLIETAAGQGSETPVEIEGLAQLYHSIDPNYKKYVGFCIDTCHVFASGECDMRKPDKIDEFVAKWNQHISWEHVKLIHYNDSICEFKSRVDRHAEPGAGCIGKLGLEYFKRFCLLTGKSLISEY